MEIVKIKNQQLADIVINVIRQDETLDDLDVNEVFDRCLSAFGVAPEQCPDLITSYNEIIRDIQENDCNAE